MRKTVAIVGTLDTKGVEYRFLKERIEAEGVSTLVIDTGILGEPAFPPRHICLRGSQGCW